MNWRSIIKEMDNFETIPITANVTYGTFRRWIWQYNKSLGGKYITYRKMDGKENRYLVTKFKHKK